jgi:hypothetical protein
MYAPEGRIQKALGDQEEVAVKVVYPVKKPRHSCLSADRYGRDDTDKISRRVEPTTTPYRKGEVKAPTR